MEVNEQGQSRSAVVSSDVGDPPESPLTVNTVAKIIANVKEPSIFALYLPGLDATLARIIDKNNSSDHFTLSQKYANAWLQNKKETPTWDKLIQALKEKPVSELTLAHDVEHYRRGSTTSTGSSFSNSLRSWNGSDLASSGNGDSLTRPGLSVKQRKVKDYTEDFTRTRIKRSFKMLTNKIAKELDTQKVSVRTIKQCIVSDRIDDNPRLGSKMRECRRIAALFRFFETKKLWDFENYDLVTQVIELIEDEECKTAMRASLAAYIKELNGYNIAQELATRLPYYLDEEYPECQEEEYDSWFCTELRKKLDCYVRITNESLQFVSELWTVIRDRYDIPSLTALLYSIVYGSLVVTWLIQPSWACCILREILTSAAFFQKHLIVKVVLDGQCIYIEENGGITDTNALCSLWLKQASLSGRVQKFQEVLDQPDIDINTTLSKDNETPLIIASYHGHIELVRFLLDNGADSSATLSHLENGTSQSSRKMTSGQTALHLAAIEGFSDVAGILHRDNNELLGAYDQRGYSPLMEAADRNHVDVARVLTEHYSTEVDSTEIPTLNEAFLLAVEKGHTEIVQILHRYGANTSTVTEDERTALMIAAAAGHTLIVEYFLNIDEMESEMKQSPDDIEEKTAALSLAIENGYFGIVEKLLQSKSRALIVDTLDSDGMTPLMRAVWRQLPELVSIVAEAGAELDLMNNDCKTALMLAAESGQRLIVEMLLTKGADVNLQQETTGKTALHLASENGHLDVVEELVKPKYKADVAIGDKDGRTAHDVAKSEEIKVLVKTSVPITQKWTFLERMKKLFTFPNAKLISACKAGNLEQVKACIKAGANPNYVDKLDPFGWTGLMWASQNGHAEVVKFLLDNKADPNLKAKGSWTALILASRKAHYKVVEHLVNNGADVLIQNWQGWSALMWAAYCPGKKNQKEEALGNRVKTAEILISKDRSIMDIPANDQWTPLIQASLDGNAGLVELLTKEGANRELHTKRHWTALMLATKHNKKEVVKALVEGGADVEHQKPADGMSALHVACVRGYTECLETMIEPQPGTEHKVNLDLKDKWGMTPLMLATKHGNKKAAETLVKAGASVNVKSEKYAGWSALFFAIKEGYLEIAKFLLENKANMSEKDTNKQTPLGLAFSQRKDIYTKLIGFLGDKPQVLKAISSTAEASADTSHDKATPQPAVSPTQEETPDTQSPSKSDKHSGEADPLKFSSGQAQVETESAPADVATLKQLMIEAETFTEPRASVNIKHLEGNYQRFRREAMQSERQAAGAA